MFIRSVCQMAMLVMLACSTANASVISIYTDRSAWELALAGASFNEESFDGEASSFAANSSANSAGLVSVDMLGGVGDPGPTGLTGGGYFQGEVDSSRDGLNIRFHHAAATGLGLLGLQNDSASNAGSLDLQELAIFIAGEYFLVSDLLGLTDSSTATGTIGSVENTTAIPFIGFVLDMPIISFIFAHGDQAYAGGVRGASEEFYLDGVVVASQRAGLARQFSLPEPGSLILLLSGFAVLFVNKHKGISNS